MSEQISQIDSSSNDGVVPDTVVPTIEFKDVVFNYPARPDVQVFLLICSLLTLCASFAILDSSWA